MTQQVIISGNVGKDAELRTVRDSQVLSFNVGVKNGLGKDAGSVWYRCSLWGKAAESFSGSLKKGTKVFIIGDLIHDEYEGKPQYNVRVGSIDTAPRSEAGASNTQSNASSQNQHITYADDLDSEIPF
jgi:single-strand DNA-binding protein